MDKATVIALARQAGIDDWWDSGDEQRGVLQTHLEQFAALIEEHLTYSSIHTCHPGCTKPPCVAMRKAVEAELVEALRWIDKRCPSIMLEQPLHKVHAESAYDAGWRARAALAKVQGESE